MIPLTEVAKEIILIMDSNYNYTTKIARKLNRTHGYSSKIMQNLIKLKLVRRISMDTRTKYLELTKKGLLIKEKLIEWENIK